MYSEEIKRLPFSEVEHTVSGTFDEVLDKLREVVQQYHPLGYGTAVVSMVYRTDPEGSRWVARIKRSASCG